MLENGMRLQVSVTDKDFTIIDTLSDKVIIYKNGVYLKDDLVHEDVINNLMGIETLALGSKPKRNPMHKSSSQNIYGFTLTELKHCEALVRYGLEEATISEKATKSTWHYTHAKTINYISQIVEKLAKDGNTILSPKNDVCRRIMDLGLFVLKSSEHIVVTRESNKVGNILTNCLVDNTMFQWVYVSLNKDEQLVYIFNCDFNQVATFTYDKSFAVYFEEDNDLFKEVS